MRGFSGVGLAWVTATIVAITIAAAAVSSVRSEVTDIPTALGVAASPLAIAVDETRSAPPLVDPSTNQQPAAEAAGSSARERIPEAALFAPPRPEEATTTTVEEPTTKRIPRGNSADPDESVSNTPSSPQDVDSTPNTPTPIEESPNDPPSRTATSTTTTTTSAPEPEVESYARVISTEGGSVSVLVTGDNVSFQRGFARDGWKMDIAQSGPSAVRVRYQRTDNQSITISLDARVASGELVVTISGSQ